MLGVASGLTTTASREATQTLPTPILLPNTHWTRLRMAKRSDPTHHEGCNILRSRLPTTSGVVLGEKKMESKHCQFDFLGNLTK
uniref:Secreted protein n=1 Tax=Echinococcus granulosus TaxID=6210 RepID=A0A068WVB0_ECHGR|nr:hypothetical protein EgrG_000361100 [Echinococcus granulosus]